MAVKKSRKLTATAVAALMATALFTTLLHKAPHVSVAFPVTSPSTRGFGQPCTTSDFTSARFFGLGTHTWNKGALLPLEAVVQTVERLNMWQPHTFSGSYSCRMVRGSTSTWSHHAWAVAVDFDAAQNCLGCSASSSEIGQHKPFVQTWIKYGFYWGGNFSSRPDPMHFEYDGPKLPVYSTRFPGGRDAHNVLANLLIKAGLPGVKDGTYGGKKEETAVLAFQKKNGLLKVDRGGIVGPATLTLLMLEARSK